MKLTVESLFNVLVFTDDEGSSVLRISHETELVVIGFPFEQEVDCSAHAVVTGIVQWRPASIVQSHDVGTAAQQKLEASIAAFPASLMERSAFQLIFELKASLSREQESYDALVVVHGSEMKWCLELIGECVDVCSSSCQHFDCLKVAIVGRVMQSSPAVAVDGVDVGVQLENRGEHLLLLSVIVAAQDSFVDWCLSYDTCFGVNIFSTVY
jgi:hypothetical protein